MGIQQERQRLEELRGRAHRIIDTSSLTARELRQEVGLLFGDTKNPQVHGRLCDFFWV